MSTQAECLFETIGHHVCQDSGEEAVKKGAPFASTRNDKFLGDGYYFWEDHLPLAKNWGGIVYISKKLDYRVCEFAISCKTSEFYDLVGNRVHQKHIVAVRQILMQRRKAVHGWPIGKIVEFLKLANQRAGSEFDAFRGKFPYLVIRAVDSSYPFSKDTVNFAETNDAFTDLNPCYVICVIDINKVVLGPIKLVYASKMAK